jgi:uncharacterized protein DUF4404
VLAVPRGRSYAAAMEKKRLLDTLDALRAEVARADEVDPAMVDELQRVTDEIRQSDVRAVEKRGDDGPQGLKGLLLRFEAEHPQFSVAVGRVADALAAMGF